VTPADPGLREDVSPRPATDKREAANLVSDLQETFTEIERKRASLPFVTDRERTRRFHVTFLVTYGLVVGVTVIFSVKEGALWPVLGGALAIGPIAGVFAAVAVGASADSAGDLHDLWCWVTGRKRRHPNLDRIAERLGERAATGDSSPSDPETSITPDGPATCSEDLPCPEQGSPDPAGPTSVRPVGDSHRAVPPDDQSIAPAN
jgi:hypothetical protein